MRWRRQIISRRSSSMLPLMLIHAVNEYRRLERKPPVTAGLLAANTLIYLRPGFLDRILPSIDEVWFNAHVILKQRDLKRFFLSAFYHLGESHLVYNMMSLLWKGTQLEISMGSVEFASMVASLLGLSQGITLLLAKSLTYFDYKRAYYHEYAVGFSGVLFAMKVVLNSHSESYSNVQGFVVPARYAAWAELILIQLLVPDASFLGHLGGILAGIVYMRIKSFCRGPDPLTIITRGLTNLVGQPLRFVMHFFQSRNGGIHGRGRSGRSQTTWRCRACTFDNSGWLSVCEVCGMGQSDDQPSLRPSTSEIPLDELRHRRIQRFGR